MRHFHGIEYIKDNEKPRQQKARRAVRRFIVNLKHAVVLAGCAAGAALIIGCGGCAEMADTCDEAIMQVEASGCPDDAGVECSDGWLVLDCGGTDYRPGISCTTGSDGYPMADFNICKP
jgi:hypothetical protein